jgi:SAM-dependent methyltransferase
MADWHESFFAGELWVELQAALFPASTTADQVDGALTLLDLPAGARILDAPCGEGRVARILIERGYQVVGLDGSAPLLTLARASTDRARWLQGDVRELPFAEEFDAAVVMWSSFGYFDRAGDRAFAAGLRRALRPGGRLLLDLNSAETLLHRVDGRDWAHAGGVTALEERRFDPRSGRVFTTWTLRRGERVEQHQASYRLYGCAELIDLLADVGFTDARPYGGFHGEPFRVGAAHLVLVAARAP